MDCSALTKDGRPCTARPVHGTSLCYRHTPFESRPKLDTKQILEQQMRIVQKTKGDPIEKAKLIVQIATLIERMTGEKLKEEPEEIKDETPQEYAKRLRGK